MKTITLTQTDWVDGTAPKTIRVSNDSLGLVLSIYYAPGSAMQGEGFGCSLSRQQAIDLCAALDLQLGDHE